MKKLLLILCVGLLAVVFAAEVTTVEWAKLRTEPTASKANVVMDSGKEVWVKPGTYAILDAVASYVKISYKATDYLVGSKCIVGDVIANQGCKLLDLEGKDTGSVINGGVKVDSVKPLINWYKIAYKTFSGYIHKQPE